MIGRRSGREKGLWAGSCGRGVSRLLPPEKSTRCQQRLERFPAEVLHCGGTGKRAGKESRAVPNTIGEPVDVESALAPTTQGCEVWFRAWKSLGLAPFYYREINDNAFREAHKCGWAPKLILAVLAATAFHKLRRPGIFNARCTKWTRPGPTASVHTEGSAVTVNRAEHTILDDAPLRRADLCLPRPVMANESLDPACMAIGQTRTRFCDRRE